MSFLVWYVDDKDYYLVADSKFKMNGNMSKGLPNGIDVYIFTKNEIIPIEIGGTILSIH